MDDLWIRHCLVNGLASMHFHHAFKFRCLRSFRQQTLKDAPLRTERHDSSCHAIQDIKIKHRKRSRITTHQLLALAQESLGTPLPRIYHHKAGKKRLRAIGLKPIRHSRPVNLTHFNGKDLRKVTSKKNVHIAPNDLIVFRQQICQQKPIPSSLAAPTTRVTCEPPPVNSQPPDGRQCLEAPLRPRAQAAMQDDDLVAGPVGLGLDQRPDRDACRERVVLVERKDNRYFHANLTRLSAHRRRSLYPQYPISSLKR